MKKNGFILMETVVVMSILSITLILLFSSYSFILRKCKERNTFDTTEHIYKTYYIKELFDSYLPLGSTNSGLKNYIDTNPSDCTKMGPYDSYICDLSDDSYDSNRNLYQIKSVFNVDKIYYTNPYKILTNPDSNNWLNLFDATTIDYIKSLGENINKDIMIVKYKKKYTDGTYEIFHSSIEVML